MPILDGPQTGELQNIVARVFTLDELTQFMRREFGIRLAEIVNVARPTRNVAFDLIDLWLEPRELTVNFLRVLWKKFATPDVVKFCRQFPEFAPPNEPGEPPAPDSTPGTLTEDEELASALSAMNPNELASLVLVRFGVVPSLIAADVGEPFSCVVLVRWARKNN